MAAASATCRGKWRLGLAPQLSPEYAPASAGRDWRPACGPGDFLIGRRDPLTRPANGETIRFGARYRVRLTRIGQRVYAVKPSSKRPKRRDRNESAGERRPNSTSAVSPSARGKKRKMLLENNLRAEH